MKADYYSEIKFYWKEFGTICYQVERASLTQEMQDMEARVRREQKKSPEEANQAIQVYSVTVKNRLFCSVIKFPYISSSAKL